MWPFSRALVALALYPVVSLNSMAPFMGALVFCVREKNLSHLGHVGSDGWSEVGDGVDDRYDGGSRPAKYKSGAAKRERE